MSSSRTTISSISPIHNFQTCRVALPSTTVFDHQRKHLSKKRGFHLGDLRPACTLQEDDSVSTTVLPTRLNNVPHLRETRQFFYSEVSNGVKNAVADGKHRLAIRCTIPETNPEMDVYRVGTLLEMVRELAMELAVDGKYVCVCVQQSMGQGVFQGMPLSLSGVRKIMEVMDWGEIASFVQFGQVGKEEINATCEYYILIAPQNIVGSSILTNLTKMVEEAEKQGKRVILINPILKDIPSSGGVMGVRGREERIAFAESFTTAYHFRLLYNVGTYFPIKGALRYSYGGAWEVFKRVTSGKRTENYKLCGRFPHQPSGGDLTKAIRSTSTVKKKNSWW